MKSKLCLLLLLILVTIALYPRVSTMLSIERVSNRDDYNLYEMEVNYRYNLDEIISNCDTSDQSYIEAVLGQVLPFAGIKIATPDFACSSFNMFDSVDAHHKMGRNYDFEPSTSVMLVKCHPKDGYSSVALAALYNIRLENPDSSLLNRLTSLTFPFACVDGINEKGVSISILSLDGKPTRQHSGKPVLYTPLAVRLVLDRASSTAEAVEILKKYDMFAAANIDYHFYINDSSGDGRVVEYNPQKENRDMEVVKANIVTNFYAMYLDSIRPYHTDKIYTHGRERYNAIDSVFKNSAGSIGFEALKASSRGSRPDETTYKTQWSALYDNTSCSVKVVVQGDWENVYSFAVN